MIIVEESLIQKRLFSFHKKIRTFYFFPQLSNCIYTKVKFCRHFTPVFSFSFVCNLGTKKRLKNSICFLPSHTKFPCNYRKLTKFSWFLTDFLIENYRLKNIVSDISLTVFLHITILWPLQYYNLSLCLFFSPFQNFVIPFFDLLRLM